VSSDTKTQGEPLAEREALRARVADLERARVALERTVEALRETKERFQLAIRGTTDGLWDWDLVTGREWWSARYRELVGYTEDELPASYESWESILHPDDREATLEAVRLQFEENRTHEIEFRLRTKHHGYRWFLARGAMARDETGKLVRMAGSIQDIDDRKRAEEALIEAKEQLEHLLGTSPVVIYRCEPGGNYPATFISDNVERQLGYESREFTDDPQFWASHIHTDDAPRVMANLSGLLEKDHHVHEYRFLHRDGTYRWMHDEARLVRDADGNPLDVIGSWIDITERKRTEEERRVLEAELRQAQKMEAVGQLAAGVAHDFNNILTVILGKAELLLPMLKPGLDEGAADAARSGLEQVRSAGRRAAALTRRLLAFGRKEMARTEVLDLECVIRDAEELLRRLLREDIAFEVNVARGTRCIRADAGHIEQIVVNLVLNAQDAMPEGGTLTVTCANADLDEAHANARVGASPGPHVVFVVSDTGTGMSEETVEHIFEPFYTTKPMGKGTGLGLATVYGILRQTGAHISVESELRKGSTFKVYFPAVDDEPIQAQAVASAEESGGDEVILVCEDEEEVRRLVCEVLRSAGYTVLEAEHGRHALEVAAGHRGPIHLLVSDVIMRELDGRKLSQEMTRTHPGLQVIFVSGYTDYVLDSEVSRGKSVDFLQKPFTPAALLQRVRELLDQPR
jgi:PAS domain S-box-containing protein